MKVLIRKAYIVDPLSPHHQTRKDILVDSGFIRQVEEHISADAREIAADNLHVSPGWIDIFAHFCDPGFEIKETLESGARAAASGGFTSVFVIPNTRPAIDSKSQVEYIRHKSAAYPVNILPIGAISRNTEGKDLAEMYDMNASGAVAFSDGLQPIQSAGILLKALQYVKAFEGVIIQIPDDKSVGANGLMHEGIISTRLGLPGKPMMAEELLVARDIKLARYTNSKLHFTGVSSPKSLEYIRRAKDSGLHITCSVTPYHLYFSDEDLTDYDTNLKVYPPLRTRADVELLKDGVVNGTIDCIATHHMPHEYDSKVLEFEHARFGMIGLETCYGVMKTIFPQLPENRWIELFSIQPRKIFGLRQPVIDTDSEAEITLFLPDRHWTLDEGSLGSKSRNSPFIGRQFQGEVAGIINREKVFLKPNYNHGT